MKTPADWDAHIHNPLSACWSEAEARRLNELTGRVGEFREPAINAVELDQSICLELVLTMRHGLEMGLLSPATSLLLLDTLTAQLSKLGFRRRHDEVPAPAIFPGGNDLATTRNPHRK